MICAVHRAALALNNFAGGPGDITIELKQMAEFWRRVEKHQIDSRSDMLPCLDNLSLLLNRLTLGNQGFRWNAKTLRIIAGGR